MAVVVACLTAFVAINFTVSKNLAASIEAELMGLLFCTQFVHLWFEVTAPRLVAERSELALKEDSTDCVWLVEVAIYRLGESIGVDRGVLGLHNGALYFNGRCCSFQIGSQDLAPVVKPFRVDIQPARFSRKSKILQLAVDSQDLLFVAFDVLKTPGVNRQANGRDLDIALEHFVASRATTEPRSYPPLVKASSELPMIRQ